MSVSVDYFDPGIIEERDVSGEKRTSAEQDSARHHIIVSEKSFLFFFYKIKSKNISKDITACIRNQRPGN